MEKKQEEQQGETQEEPQVYSGKSVLKIGEIVVESEILDCCELAELVLQMLKEPTIKSYLELCKNKKLGITSPYMG